MQDSDSHVRCSALILFQLDHDFLCAHVTCRANEFLFHAGYDSSDRVKLVVGSVMSSLHVNDAGANTVCAA